MRPYHAAGRQVGSTTSRSRPRRTNRRAYCRVLNGYGALARGRHPNRYGWSWSPASAPSREPCGAPEPSCCEEVMCIRVLSAPGCPRRLSFGSLRLQASVGTGLGVHDWGALVCFGVPAWHLNLVGRASRAVVPFGWRPGMASRRSIVVRAVRARMWSRSQIGLRAFGEPRCWQRGWYGFRNW